MGYFFLTVAYTFLVPFLLHIFFFTNSIFLPPFVFILFMLAFAFGTMFLYGYLTIRFKKHPDKPDSMTGLYFPVFFPLIWYLFLNGYCNLKNISIYGGLFSLILILLSFNGFGLLVILQDVAYGSSSGMLIFLLNLLGDRNCIFLLNLLYYAVLILGFAVGERLASGRRDIHRNPFKKHKKIIIASIVFIFIAYGYTESVYQMRHENILPSGHADYGFAYEGGYSSINLKPYYVENEENILAKLDEPSDFTISNPADMPFLDGAEAAYPVYSAFANACYENIAGIQAMAKNKDNNEDMRTIMPVQFSNTIHAYEKLLDGEIDIFFGARPSEEQLQMAEDAGKVLVLTTIGKEAFVFFVNEENPVDSLSSEQIRAIYSGEINNWRKVGGKNKKILAFQRPENSGSQTMMEYFMGDIPLKEPLQTEYEDAMSGVIRHVAAYDNSASSIGYSFRYYTTIMMNAVENISDSTSEESTGIKFLTIDDVYPDTETIRSEEYPLTTQLYAITVRNAHPGGTYYEDIIEPFLEWMTGPQGQRIVADTGYVSLE